MSLNLNVNQPTGPAAPRQPFGRIISVRGSLARVGLHDNSQTRDLDVRATVGRFVSIRAGSSSIIAMITEISREDLPEIDREEYIASASVDLLGEIDNSIDPPKFQRGVTGYPAIGDATELITNAELRTVYAPGTTDAINIGQLQQDASVTAYVNVQEMLCKHFAVLGTTGVGKSSGVSMLLNEILVAKPSMRIMLLDVHNEYGRCFGQYAQVLNPRNLKLPFWLFNYEEFVDVIYGGRPGVPEELEVLTDVIPQAKATYVHYVSGGDRGSSLKRLDAKATGFTVDTPVPYRLVDLISLIDDKMGKLENRSQRIFCHKLIQRIEAVRNDPRYAFMFENANVGGDTMAEVVSLLFRMPANGKPMTVMQLAGFPVEVVDSVVSVLCRMAFDFGLWSDGASPLLFVCEEAHRYASADRSVGFGPTRKAVSRIAKEGRKYGVFMGLITQRPAELDATIISQCSTLFAMRLANDRDQALLRSAVSDAAANLLSFVPSLGTREVLAFGEGVALPTRLRFKELPREKLPRGEATVATVHTMNGVPDFSFVASVVERWRGATTHSNSANIPDSSASNFDRSVRNEMAPSIQPAAAPMPRPMTAPMSAPMSAPMPAPAPMAPAGFGTPPASAYTPPQTRAPVQPALGLDPERFSLLKKPLR